MQNRPAILFWDVDTQNDFVRRDGALAVPGAEEIRSNLARLTGAAREHGIPVLASADHHRLEDEEISETPDWEETFPPHCMQGTEGQQKVPESRIPGTEVIGHEELAREEVRRRVRDAAGSVLILKKRFDVFTNPNTDKVLSYLEPQSIVLYGVALDVCNKAAMEGLLARHQKNISVVTDLVRALDESNRDPLLTEWESRGVDLVTTDEVLARIPTPVSA